MRGQEKTAYPNSKCPASAQPLRMGNAKNTSSYWKKKLEKVIGRGGVESPHYSVRVVHQKRRVRFPLSTSNKDAAANKAAEIFRHILQYGWETTLERYKPQVGQNNHMRASHEPEKPDTVGALIECARKHSTAREQSFVSYERAFRRIVAAITGIADNGKYDTGREAGNKAWRASVDSVKLSEVTPVRIQEWRTKYLKKAGKTPESRKHATVTMNSLIRNAKTLFSKKLLPFIKEEIKLPDELPFDNILFEKSPSMRYRSRIDARDILRKGREELKKEYPESYKILLLSLVCGLRISEIDYLLWDSFDLENSILKIEDSKYHKLKSEDSYGELDLDEGMVLFFSACRDMASGEFVIESDGRTERRKGSRAYRCKKQIGTLLAWLRENGVEAPKPIHELRKEIGSIIANEQGIFAASRYLRHSDIRITSAIYADKKDRVIPEILSNEKI